MTNKQPEALRLAELLELAPEDGIEPQTTEDAAAELRRQHAEIESLQATIEIMGEEHADELMVAHLDGRSQAAQQPAPSAAVASKAVLAAYRAARTTADSVTAPAAYSGNLEQELAMLIRRIVSSARRNCEDGSNVLKLANEAWTYLVRKGLNGSPLRDAGIESDPTPPAQAADSVLEDAARLDWLLLHISGAEFRRIGVHYSGNASRADVDAARKQGANHD